MGRKSSAVAAGVDSNFSSGVADASAGAEPQSKKVKDFTECISDNDDKPTQGQLRVVASEVSEESECTQGTAATAMDVKAVGAARGISAVAVSTNIEEYLPLPLSHLVDQPGGPHPLPPPARSHETAHDSRAKE